MVLGKPLACVRAFGEAVDKASAAHSPGQCRSTLQGAWLAWWITALLVTNAICGARVDRASLGTQALAAWSWMLRQAKMPWEPLVVARVRVRRDSSGLTGGSLGIDDPAKRRSKTATPLAPLDTLRDQESGGYIGGQRLVFRWWVTPPRTIPMGWACQQPAPELSAWDHEDTRRPQRGVPTPQRPPHPPPQPTSPTTPELARRLGRPCQAPHPARRVPWMVADALYGASPLVDAASALLGGVPVSSQLRSHPQGRVSTREQSVAEDVTTHPGTPQTIRLRGGEEIAVLVGRARLYVWAHHTQRLIRALTDEGEASERALMASDLTWRPLDIVQGPTVRWLVEGVVPDGKSQAGWTQWPKPPGKEGARPSVLLRLVVDQCLFLPPDPLAQRHNHLPA